MTAKIGIAISCNQPKESPAVIALAGARRGFNEVIMHQNTTEKQAEYSLAPERAHPAGQGDE